MTLVTPRIVKSVSCVTRSFFVAGAVLAEVGG